MQSIRGCCPEPRSSPSPTFSQQLSLMYVSPKKSHYSFSPFTCCRVFNISLGHFVVSNNFVNYLFCGCCIKPSDIVLRSFLRYYSLSLMKSMPFCCHQCGEGDSFCREQRRVKTEDEGKISPPGD